MTWRDRAACRNTGVRSFFAGGRSPAGEEARQLCAKCPVKAACLADCLSLESTDNSRVGIRGGMTPNERSAYVRKGRK